MNPQHHVSELDAINGTKSQPESGPSWDHVGTKSGPSWDQVIFQSPIQLATQLHKFSLLNYCIRFVTDQVGEQVTEQVIEHVTERVAATNHRGHRDLAAGVDLRLMSRL